MFWPVGCGRRLAPIDRVDAMGAGVVVDEVAATADPGDEWIGDAKRRGDRDGRVGGAAAAAQDPQARHWSR